MEQKQEVKRIVRLLTSTAKIAKESSLVGALKEGNKSAVRQYNSVLKRLETINLAPEGLFFPLEEDVSFDEVGVACAQLAAYLHEDEPEDHRSTGGRRPETPRIGDIVNIGGDLGDIGRIIRDAMSSAFSSQKKEGKPEEKPEPEKKTDQAEESEDLPDLNEVESQISELGSQLQVMAERIRREAILPEEKKELAEKMSQLGARYAELAKQHAEVRLHSAANSEDKN